MPARKDHESDEVRREFAEAVDMPPKELEEWLETPESIEVGQKVDDGESVGHASGRRVVEIQRTREDDLSHDDFELMR